MSALPQASNQVSVAILLPTQCWAGSVHLVRELLQIVGTLRSRKPDVLASVAFDVRLVGVSKRAVMSFGGVKLQPELSIREIRDGAACDVIIVPAQFMPDGQASPEDVGFAQWISKQHAQGAVVVSIGGAVLLAKTGLLDGKEASGLVSDRNLFQRHFPLVRYHPSRRIVASGNIVTVCGVGPTVDACAHLVERFFGSALAHRFLRHTSVELMPAQEQLNLWSARYRRHCDAQVLAAQDRVERELQQMPTIDHLAAKVGLSARALTRRWLLATGLNFRPYVAALRLELSETLLRTTDLPLKHIATECGFSCTSALTRAFTQRFGKGPHRYRMDVRLEKAGTRAVSP